MEKTNLKDIAIDFLKNSKVSVIPVGKDKVPLISWKEYQTRFPTVEEIESWWQKYPDAQVGICTGKLSNLIVVDVEEGGDPSFLPQDTTIVKTGGGGWHYYYRFVDGVQNKARIRELVDIRGEGGYVVAPGSSSLKGSYELLSRKKPLIFPKHLFSAETKELASEVIHVPVKHELEPAPEEVQSDSFFLLESYQGYGKGSRNEEMTRFIGKVLARIHPLHWDKYGWEIILKANQKNEPPLAISELYASFKSIKGREVIKTPIDASESKNGPNSGVLEQFPTEGDEVKHISTVAAEQPINQEDSYPTQMECFDELIYGGFSIGDLISIAGRTGEGKSSLSQDWTLSLIRGPKKAPVLWFSYELLPSHLWKKFKSMGMNEEDVAVIPAKHSSGNVLWVEKKIKEAKEKYGIKAVVIDHLGFLLPKTSGILGKALSQNYSSFLTQIVRDLKSLALQEEVIIILPVHVKKGEKGDSLDLDSIKDTSGVAQESDLTFLIERERNKDKNANDYYTEYTKITLAKNRKTGKTKSAWFTMMNERFVYSDRNHYQEIAKAGWNAMTKITSLDDDDEDDDDIPTIEVPIVDIPEEPQLITRSLLDEF